MQDATEYVHRAGRAGRIGSTTGGEVVSVVTPEELPALLDMVSSQLGLHLEVLDLAQQQQQQQQLGLLSADYAAAREELLREQQQEQEQAEEGPGGAASDTEGQSGGGAAADGQKVQQLDAARRGLEDLFNLL
jgi:superfamily II DNA/RNA helicase